MEENKKEYWQMTEEEKQQFLKDKLKQYGRDCLKEEKPKESCGAYYLDGDVSTIAWR